MTASSASSAIARSAQGRGQVVERRRPRRVLRQRTRAGLLQAPQGLVEGRPERPVDRHHLAGGLHLAAQGPVGAGELVEREARQLHDQVVEGRLEGGHGRPRHDVRDLREPPSDGDLGGDAGDRVARGLAREGRAAAHPGVDLDDGVVARVRREGELDVAAALHAEAPDDRERGGPEPLVDGVGERLDGGDHDRVAGVDAERVHVLHRADGDARVVGVAHHLVLDLLPADQALLDHHLADRAGAQAGPDPFPVGGLRLDDPAPGAAEREGRPDDRRQADRGKGGVARDGAILVGRPFDDRRGGVRLLEPVQEVAELLAVLGHLDRPQRRAQHADVVAC